MQEIDFSNYFWQDEEIRLRSIEPEDWERHYINRFDTPARRLLECAVELPPTISEAKKFAETYADFSSGRLMFTIEKFKSTETTEERVMEQEQLKSF